MWGSYAWSPDHLEDDVPLSVLCHPYVLNIKTVLHNPETGLLTILLQNLETALQISRQYCMILRQYITRLYCKSGNSTYNNETAVLVCTQ